MSFPTFRTQFYVFLFSGDKELNILKLDPLKISKLELNSGSNLKLTLTDVAIVGLKTFHARKIEYAYFLVLYPFNVVTRIIYFTFN